MAAEQQNVSIPMNAGLGEDKALKFMLTFEKDLHGNFQLDELDVGLQENG